MSAPGLKVVTQLRRFKLAASLLLPDPPVHFGSTCSIADVWRLSGSNQRSHLCSMLLSVSTHVYPFAFQRIPRIPNDDISEQERTWILGLEPQSADPTLLSLSLSIGFDDLLVATCPAFFCQVGRFACEGKSSSTVKDHFS